MEAVPRLPMLSFELRTSTEPAQFAPPIRTYLMSFYQEQPDAYNDELHKFQSIRAAAMKPPMDVQGCQMLKKYYCQLHYLKSRFPMCETEAAAVNFSWKDAYSNLSFSMPDIRFELMCIIYNIGALHTQLGAQDSRTDPKSMKMACTHFQCAAWAFQAMLESYYQMVSCLSSTDLMQFMREVCLAQAQECILEKSMLDNRKAIIIAKVAIQVVDFYRQALNILQNSSGVETHCVDYVPNKVFKEWVKFLTLKMAYYRCVSFLFQGQQAEETRKMGERVAYYQAACDQLEEAAKLLSSIKTKPNDVKEVLMFTRDVVEGKRKAAKNENEFIYHEEIPNVANLEEVKGASLVKGIPFNVHDPDVSGPDIFMRLVPMETHEAASMYSELKAQLLRQMSEEVNDKNTALDVFFGSMQLEFLKKMKTFQAVPQDLIDRAAVMSNHPNVCEEITSLMDQLNGLHRGVVSTLDDIEKLLAQDKNDDQTFQDRLGGQQPPSIISTELGREAAKYREAATKACESNDNLHKVMTVHIKNLKFLQQQPLRDALNQLPSLQIPDENIDDSILTQLERLVGKMEEMRAQRNMFMTQLRDDIQKDDITSILLTRSSARTLDYIFEQELKKHDKTVALLQQNLAAQENICDRMVNVYADATKTRRYIQDIITKRQSTIASIINSCDTYKDLISKINKGIEFYTKLDASVSKLLQRARSACQVKQEQREQMLQTQNVTPSSSLTQITVSSAPVDIVASCAPLATATTTVTAAPKLKDYLESRNKTNKKNDTAQVWPTATLPTQFNSSVQTNVPETTESYNMQAYNPQPIASTQYTGYTQTPSSYHIDNAGSTSVSAVLNGPYPSAAVSESVSTYSGHTTVISIAANQAPPSNSYGNNTQVSGPSPAPTYSPHPPNISYYGTHQPYAYDTPTNCSNTGAYYANGTTLPTNVSYTQMGMYPVSYGNEANNNAAIMQHAYNNEISYSNSGFVTANASFSGVGPNSLNDSMTGNLVPSNANTNHQYTVTQPYAPSSALSNQYNYTASDSSGQMMLTQQQPVEQQQSLQQQQLQPLQQQQPQPLQQQHQPPQMMYSSMDLYQQQQAGSLPYGVQQYAQQPMPPQTEWNISNWQHDQGYANGYYAAQPISSDYAMNSAVASSATSLQYVPAQISNVRVATPPKPSSNIDLLSGLDFSVSQQPLTPQRIPSIASLKISDTTDGSYTSTTSLNTTTSTVPLASSTTNAAPTVTNSAVSSSSVTGVATLTSVTPSSRLNINRKPIPSASMRKLFQAQVDRWERFVDQLAVKTLNGQTNLEMRWREVQERAVAAQSGTPDSSSVSSSAARASVISVARCYPMKNRSSDILPYDGTRVVLRSALDDYINASHVTGVAMYAPNFIVTQTPLPGTIADFWYMICEHSIDMLVCLVHPDEMNATDIYWPRTVGQPMSVANFSITLMSESTKGTHIERFISVVSPTMSNGGTTDSSQTSSRVIIHLQLLQRWPVSNVSGVTPTTGSRSHCNGLAQFVHDFIVLFQQQQQQHVEHPITVHCDTGGTGRSGVFCLLLSAIFRANNMTDQVALDADLPDLLLPMAVNLLKCRRHLLRDKEHLRLVYECLLTYADLVLDESGEQRGKKELPPSETNGKNDDKKSNIDPLSELDPFWVNRK